MSGRARYRMVWLRVDGGYDFRSHYNEAFGKPDPVSDKVRSQQAVMTVAQRLCGGKPELVASAMDGTMHVTRVRFL